jgi:hypothetical protein
MCLNGGWEFCYKFMYYEFHIECKCLIQNTGLFWIPDTRFARSRMTGGSYLEVDAGYNRFQDADKEVESRKF